MQQISRHNARVLLGPLGRLAGGFFGIFFISFLAAQHLTPDLALLFWELFFREPANSSKILNFFSISIDPFSADFLFFESRMADGLFAGNGISIACQMEGFLVLTMVVAGGTDFLEGKKKVTNDGQKD